MPLQIMHSHHHYVYALELGLSTTAALGEGTESGSRAVRDPKESPLGDMCSGQVVGAKEIQRIRSQLEEKADVQKELGVTKHLPQYSASRPQTHQ